jgi:hypothetical protein
MRKPYRCAAFYVKPPPPDDRGIRFEGRRYSVRLKSGRRLPAIFGTRADARNARDAHEARDRELASA